MGILVQNIPSCSSLSCCLLLLLQPLPMLLTILGVLTTWGLWCHVLFNITHTIHRDTVKTRMTSKKTKKTKERNRLDNRGNREEERVNRQEDMADKEEDRSNRRHDQGIR